MIVATDFQSFVAGAIAMGFLVAVFFFLRFWKRTRDELFLAFAAAFALLALNQALPTLIEVPEEERSWVYLFRLAGFIILIAAILRKNAQGRRKPQDGSTKDDRRSKSP